VDHAIYPKRTIPHLKSYGLASSTVYPAAFGIDILGHGY
jgi:hypothetical protein